MSEVNLASEISRALNRASAENESGTPDFILAQYLHSCLKAFDLAVAHRAHWRGESVELPALQRQVDTPEVEGER